MTVTMPMHWLMTWPALPSIRPAVPPYSLDREHAGQQRADDAADAMDAEAVERVVIAEHVLEAGRAPVAADAAGDADAPSRRPDRRSPKPA